MILPLIAKDFQFQSRFSNKDQIYPLPESIKKLDNIYKMKTLKTLDKGNKRKLLPRVGKQLRLSPVITPAYCLDTISRL